MPVNINFTFEFKIFGIKGDGYYNAHIKNYNFQSIDFSKFETNETLKVMDGANQKDSTYWLQTRPIALTQQEKNDYKQKDSLEIITANPNYKDSIDKLDNKFNFGNLLFGYTYHKTKKQIQLKFPGLISNGIQYNTVEGVNASYQVTFEKSHENLLNYLLVGRIRYGFENKLWGGEIFFQKIKSHVNFTNFGFKIKSIVEQYNQAAPINPIVNSFYTLFLNQNYMKLFKETAIELNYNSEIINGIYFGSIVKYAQRDPLINHSNYLFIDNPNLIFSSNDPRHASTNDSMFTSNNAFTTEFNFMIRFKQKYFTIPHQKIIIRSKYPQINLMYKRAFPILNSTANYDLLVASISDEFRLGLLGRLSYKIRGGGFLNYKKLYFMDFKYFLGNQTLINTSDYMNSFKLLPYYTFSADRWFAELHSEHHFKGLIINKIPLIKKLSVQEFVGFHALASNKIKYYYELNFGIEKLFKVIRLDYILSYQPNIKFNQGFTFGYVLRF
jgi:hypothetical protein